MREYGTNENHEFLNVASDIGSEVLKMYALNAAGMFAVGGGGNRPGGVGDRIATALSQQRPCQGARAEVDRFIAGTPKV